MTAFPLHFIFSFTKPNRMHVRFGTYSTLLFPPSAELDSLLDSNDTGLGLREDAPELSSDAIERDESLL